MDATYAGSNAGAAGIQEVQFEAAGDVVLVIGEPPVYAIMVSSDKLARMSPVFEAMLSPIFRERLAGQRSLEPEEFYLREDDADAMLHICLMLYNPPHQNGSLTASGLHRLIKTLDKYQCRAAFAMQVNGMARAQLEKDTPTWESAILNTAIAYLTDDVMQFKAHTYSLINAFTTKFLLTRFFDGGDTLPFDALMAMFDKRQRARVMIHRESARACVRDGTTMEAVFGLATWNRIVTEENSIDEVLLAIRFMPQGSALGALYCQIKEVCDGLCLKCVKQGVVLNPEATCGSCPGQ